MIGRITTNGVLSEYPLAHNTSPFGITAGPDGNVWFTEYASAGKIGEITPQGTITGITAGPDGNIWFTCTGAIGAYRLG